MNGRPYSFRSLPARAFRRTRAMLPRSPRPAILMYHRIGHDSFDPWGLAVTAERFREQLAWLATNRHLLSLGEFVARHRSHDLPADAVAITFDDGYACTAELAAPILKQNGLPATVFLPAALVEEGALFWWDELQQIVLSAESQHFRLAGRSFELGPKQRDDRNWKPGDPPRTPRQRAFKLLWNELHPRSPEDLDKGMAELRSQVGSQHAPHPLKRPMTAAEVGIAAAHGIEFGSHALTHPSLPNLSSDEKARQISGSRDLCAFVTGSRPCIFAYPYGDFDEESASLVRQAGFEAACITEDRCVTPDSSLFALPRIGVGNWTARQLARALARR